MAHTCGASLGSMKGSFPIAAGFESHWHRIYCLPHRENGPQGVSSGLAHATGEQAVYTSHLATWASGRAAAQGSSTHSYTVQRPRT